MQRVIYLSAHIWTEDYN